MSYSFKPVTYLVLAFACVCSLSACQRENPLAKIPAADVASWIFEHKTPQILTCAEKVWSEAMLSATLEFVRNTLGLRLVYMHTDECGARLKDIWFESRPPKSIYQDLPKRFCFEQVNYAPTFLSRSWGESKEFRDAEFRKRTARPFAFWKLEL